MLLPVAECAAIENGSVPEHKRQLLTQLVPRQNSVRLEYEDAT